MMDIDHFKAFNDDYGHATAGTGCCRPSRRWALRTTSPASAARSSPCCSPRRPATARSGRRAYPFARWRDPIHRSRPACRRQHHDQRRGRHVPARRHRLRSARRAGRQGPVRGEGGGPRQGGVRSSEGERSRQVPARAAGAGASPNPQAMRPATTPPVQQRVVEGLERRPRVRPKASGKREDLALAEQVAHRLARALDVPAHLERGLVRIRNASAKDAIADGSP